MSKASDAIRKTADKISDKADAHKAKVDRKDDNKETAKTDKASDNAKNARSKIKSSDEDHMTPAEPDSPNYLSEVGNAAKHGTVNADDAETAEAIKQNALDEIQQNGTKDVGDTAGEGNAVVKARREAEVQNVQSVDAFRSGESTTDENGLKSHELMDLARKFTGSTANPDEENRIMALRNQKVLEEVKAGENY